MITSTSNSKSGQMIKRFKDLEVDEIIESFDISDSVLNNLESSSNDQANSSDSYKPRSLRQHTVMTKGKKPRLTKNLQRKSKNSKKGRSQFTELQLRNLSDAFSENMYPSSKDRDELAHKLGLTSRQVVVYFSNHRCRKYLKNTNGGMR
jgi:hypothetical protein